MEYRRHLAVLRSESERLAAAASRAGLDAPVPRCPGWVVRDLLRHVTFVHGWAETVVRRRVSTAPGVDEVREPAGVDELERFRNGAAGLAETLAEAGSGVAVWAWAEPRTTDFWARRMAHETAVHRVDAERAAGVDDTEVDAEVAADGLDEALANLAHRPSRRIPHGNGETLHLHCTDVPGEWLVTLRPEAPVVAREHAKADVAVQGPASRLLLLVWNRVAPDDQALAVYGDRAILERFLAEAAV